MGKSKQSSRKKPNRRREDGPFVGVKLRAYFQRNPENEYQLVRPLAERLLLLMDSPKLRRLYREEFGLESGAAVPNIPTDSILAQICDRPLAYFRQGRDTGRFHDALWFWEYAGRGRTHRTCHDLHWFPINDRRTTAELGLQFSLYDVPRESRGRVITFAMAFFDAVAENGAAYANATITRIYPHDEDLNSLDRNFISELWHEGQRHCDHYLPGVRWMNLLSRGHVQKLGGATPFLQEWERLRIGRISPKLGQSQKVYDTGHLLLRAVAYDFTNDLMPEWGGIGHWLLCRFAQANLLLVQSDELMARMTEVCHKDFSYPVHPSFGAAPTDAEIAEREEHFRVFMDRVWGAPPRCAAGSAVPLSPRERATVRRATGGHGDQMTGFWIRRNRSEKPLGVWGPPSDWCPVGEPLLIGGPTRTDAAFVFDSAVDGWDGEFGHVDPVRRSRFGNGRPAESYHCSRCGHDRFHCQVRFEYSPEPGDFEEPDVAERPQDFFTWFTLIATCAQCDKRKTLFEMECA